MATAGGEERRASWAVWLLAAALALHLLMMGSLFWGYLDALFYSVESVPKGLDFFAVYEAGHRAIEHRSLYTHYFWNPGGASEVTPHSSPYRYVPVFAYAFGAPANAVPPWWAFWGWLAFNELLLVVNAYATWRVAGRGTWGAVAATMWFVFPALYIELYLGQFSFLMATALLWTGIGLVSGRQAMAGVPWALSLVAKTNSALLAPLFLRLRWWPTLAGGAALLALNVPYFLWRPEDFDYFREQNATSVFQGSGEYTVYSPANHGAAAALQNAVLALDSSATDLAQACAILLTIGVVAVSLAVTFLAPKLDPLVIFAVWVCSFFLFYPAVWEFHYVMLLPALVLLVAFRPHLRPLALAVFVLVALPTPYWLLNNVWNTGPLPEWAPILGPVGVWPKWGAVLYHAVKPAPVAVLWAYLATSQLREGISLAWFARPRVPAPDSA